MNWIDWVIIICLAIAALRGMARGLAISVAAIVGTLGGLFVAWQASGPLAAWLELTTGAVSRLTAFFARYMDRVVPATTGSAQLTQGTVAQALASPAIPPAVRDFLSARLTQTAQLATDVGTAASMLARTLAGALVTAAAFIVVYYLCSAIAIAIGRTLNRAADRSILNLPNHLGGAAFGLLQGAVVAMLLIGVLSLIMPLLPPDSAIVGAFAGSRFGQLLIKAFYTLIPLQALFPSAGM